MEISEPTMPRYIDNRPLLDAVLVHELKTSSTRVDWGSFVYINTASSIRGGLIVLSPKLKGCQKIYRTLLLFVGPFPL